MVVHFDARQVDSDACRGYRCEAFEPLTISRFGACEKMEMAGDLVEIRKIEVGWRAVAGVRISRCTIRACYLACEI